MPEALLARRLLAQHGKHLEYFTIVWNTLEAVVALLAGIIAGSISLLGFGLDSFIELISGSTLLWRMSKDADISRRERNEKLSFKVVGICFLALAAYVALESITGLLGRKAPEHSLAGIILAAASLIVMPLLSGAKRRVARDLGSRAMKADARQTEFCSYLSAILLAGLLLNAAVGWWWADPVAALIMTLFIAREGYHAIRGEQHCYGNS
jgi:divalent metal cation (Fe/Co/Zn/Cd) transporter